MVSIICSNIKNISEKHIYGIVAFIISYSGKVKNYSCNLAYTKLLLPNMDKPFILERSYEETDIS